MACNECRGQSCNNTDMTMNLNVDDDTIIMMRMLREIWMFEKDIR